MNMIECIRCGSDRILSLSGKTSDCYSHTYKGEYYDGYVPSDIGIGGGDYIEFDLCLNCGQIQDKFPVNDPVDIDDAVEDNEPYETDTQKIQDIIKKNRGW